MFTLEERATVGRLRSTIGELRKESLPQLPDARIEEDFAELHRAVEHLDAERLRRLAEIDRRRLFERDGHLSAAAWLATRFRVAWGAAREQVRIAHGLDSMERTRRALESGEISMSAVRVLADAQGAEREAFETGEAQLVEAARLHSIGDLQRVVAFWRDRVARDGARDHTGAMRARRRLHASVSLGGMVRVDGDLDPENGESLLVALRAVLDTDARSGDREDREDRTPGQRRADALGEICRQWLDGSDRPRVAGERPHLTVTVDARALGASGGSPVGELDHTGPAGAEFVRRVACDASVRRVVMGPRSEPLDVGRSTPVVPAAMRRAVILRDRHCRFPGCDRPHTWCDSHHVDHWADGGPTSLANLLLLCRRHHGMVHRHEGFALELIDGRPIFRRPDGTELEAAGRAPP